MEIKDMFSPRGISEQEVYYLCFKCGRVSEGLFDNCQGCGNRLELKVYRPKIKGDRIDWEEIR